MPIDKVLEFETDADANAGIEKQRKLGYICVGHSASAVTSRLDTRRLVPSIVLAFSKVGSLPPLNARTAALLEPRPMGTGGVRHDGGRTARTAVYDQPSSPIMNCYA